MTEKLMPERFIVTQLAAGFAAAAGPPAAHTITTDAAGLIAGETRIPTRDGEMPAYHAMPEKPETFPVALVIQEIFGVDEHIQDLCRRLAKSGYLAVAPELYARQGDVSKMQDAQEIRSKVVSKVPDEQVMSDLDAAVSWAGKSGRGDTGRLAITGFCWGGRIAWLYAAHSAQLKAAAAWYGRLSEATDPFHPKNPIDVVSELKAPVLGLYGAKDQGIPLSSVEQMRSALKAAGSKSEIIVYPDAGHGFNADYRPSYHRESAQNAWKRMLEWFREHGAA
jgi:carboxymethylenebutenolidase